MQVRADQHIEVGQRVKAARQRAGLSQEQLAGLSDVSLSLIKAMENGRRALTLKTAGRIAGVVHVKDLGDFYGPSVRLSLDGRPSHPAVPEIRRALTAWQLTATGEPATAEYLLGAVDSAWRTWHTSRRQRSEAAATLPGLLDTAQRSARLLDGEARREALPMLAEACHLAQAFLAWHGDRELMWLCVDRGMAAALESDRPLAIAGAAWYAAHLLRAVGRGDDALDRLTEARTLIEPRMGDDPPNEVAAALADNYLCSALTRARAADSGAWRDWETAREIVHRVLPADYVGLRTRVGRVLTDVYAVMIAVDLGDPDAARRRAAELDPSTIPSTDRRARHLLELARGADLEGSAEATLHLLDRAAAVSTETVAFSPAGRELATRLVAEGPATIRGEAESLARRLGIEV